MKNELNKKTVFEGEAIQPPLDAEKSELSMEQALNSKMTVKIYQEQARPYFSSPCLLSEMENNDENSSQFFF